MSDEVFERGLAIRKEMLGAEFVERSLASADAFNRPMQELTTEYRSTAAFQPASTPSASPERPSRNWTQRNKRREATAQI